MSNPSKYPAAVAAIREDYLKCDPWGWAMGWAFAVCDELFFSRGLFTDAMCGMEYHPGASKSEDDPYSLDILDAMSDEELTYLGDLLARFLDFCERKGLSY